MEEDELCGYCAHHMDSHEYRTWPVGCQECPDGVCPREEQAAA